MKEKEDSVPYNPLKKLLYHGSLKEDTLKTIEDLSKVYKINSLKINPLSKY